MAGCSLGTCTTRCGSRLGRWSAMVWRSASKGEGEGEDTAAAALVAAVGMRGSMGRAEAKAKAAREDERARTRRKLAPLSDCGSGTCPCSLCLSQFAIDSI